MIKSGKDIQWVHKAEIGSKNLQYYDVHLGIVNTKRKNYPPKQSLHFRFSEAGFKELNCQYVLYAFDEDSYRIFFKEGDPSTGYIIGSNLSFVCRADQNMCETLQMYTGRYTFDRLSDGTLFIQLEEKK